MVHRVDTHQRIIEDLVLEHEAGGALNETQILHLNEAVRRLFTALLDFSSLGFDEDESLCKEGGQLIERTLPLLEQFQDDLEIARFKASVLLAPMSQREDMMDAKVKELDVLTGTR